MIPFWNAAILIGVKLDDLKVNERSEKKNQLLEILSSYTNLETPLFMPDCLDGETFTRFSDLKFLSIFSCQMFSFP